MTIHTNPPRATRVVIRLPKGMSVRDALAAQIETLINRLDALDPDPDLEPYLAGSDTSAHVDAEGDSADDEPWLGSAAGDGNQEHWNQGGDEGDDADDEAEPDDEDGGDTEPNGDERDFTSYDGLVDVRHMPRDAAVLI